jgi:hypothetical protein
MAQVGISDAIREAAIEPSRELDEVLDTHYASVKSTAVAAARLTVPDPRKWCLAYAAGS